MSSNFRFIQQAIQLEYELQTDIPHKICEAAKERGSDRHLNVNALASKESITIIQSPTGSTQVQLLPSQTNMATYYFGEYAATEASESRKKYCHDKLSSLFYLLERAGVCPLYFGISNIVRMSAAGIHPDKLKKAAMRVLDIPSFMSEETPIFDFSFRVARVVPPKVEGTPPLIFSNININWYQTRSYSGPATMIIRIWDMNLNEEGLEFKYDRNNKYGLMSGKRDWSFKDFLEIMDQTMNDIGQAFQVIEEGINKYLKETKDA